MLTCKHNHLGWWHSWIASPRATSQMQDMCLMSPKMSCKKTSSIFGPCMCCTMASTCVNSMSSYQRISCCSFGAVSSLLLPLRCRTCASCHQKCHPSSSCSVLGICSALGMHLQMLLGLLHVLASACVNSTV